MAILDETPNPLPLAAVAADPAATATVRPPQQVAPPMTSYRRSLRAELLPIIVLPFVLTASAAGLWPLWQQPPLAAVTTLVVSALVTTGLVLLSEPEQRAPALGMIFAAALLEVSWGDEWSSRPLLPLNLILGHSWLLVLGWALYRYPGGPLRPVERRSFQLIAVWVMLWPWALILSSQPTWLHYPPGTGWPSLWPDRAVFAVTLELVNLSAVIILGLYVVLWVHRLRTTPAARLRSTVPSAVAGILGAGGGALVPISDALNLPPAWLGPIDAASIVGVLAVPAALLVAVARRHLARAALAGLLVELSGAASVEAAIPALRRALGDPSVSVGLWSARDNGYFDQEGDPVEAARPDIDHSAYRVAAVRSSTGEPLAIVIGDAWQHNDGDLFNAATAAFALSLENARLLQTARRELGDLRAASVRAASTGPGEHAAVSPDRLPRQQPAAPPEPDHRGQAIGSSTSTATPTSQVSAAGLVADIAARAERRRIEQDLHDGAQARFLALAPLIGAAQARTADPAMSAALAEIKNELRAALLELRRLAHGEPGSGDREVRPLPCWDWRPAARSRSA